MSRKLANYLRTHRKRAGLSQDDVAYLLGTKSGTKVSRYERFARQPTLRTALAYEALFHAPVRELFAGISQEVELATAARARQLVKKLQRTPSNRVTARKLALLEAVMPPRPVVTQGHAS